MAPEVGRQPLRLGRYTLVRSLGAGGMAELFLARADGIGGFAKLVALKRIRRHKATNERFVRMLLNEARLVATLDHPNIAAVHDIEFEDDEYFFAMEYVHGHDLRRVLRDAPSRQLHLENALHVALGVCAGLHHAHEARDPSGRSLEIVHRDVSPSNVLIGYQGAVKLVDFGVAKAATLVSETREGGIKGKYGYLSPEQCLGMPLDRRSDLFAVGILLWEMTVGRRLYKLDGELATLQRVAYVDAPPPSRFIRDYPPELEQIVLRALARDPGQRYQTAEQLQIDLEAFALERRLPVSAVTMSSEMRQLFRERIDAWREAERAGRSLADHLAEVSAGGGSVNPEDTVSSSDVDGEGAPEHGEIDDGLEHEDPTAPVTLPVYGRPSGVTEAQRLSSVTEAQRLSAAVEPVAAAERSVPVAIAVAAAAATPTTAAPAAPAPAAPAPTTADLDDRGPIRRPGRGWAVLAVPAILGGLGATWALWQRRPEAPPDLGKPPAAAAMIAGDPSASAPAEPEQRPPRSVVVERIHAELASYEPADGARTKRDHGPPQAAVARHVATADAKVAKRANGAKDTMPANPGEDPEDSKGPRDSSDSRTSNDPQGARDPGSTQDAARAPEPPREQTLPVQVLTPDEPRPGTVDPTAARAAVRAHLGEIETCVGRARMEDRDLKGAVVLQIALTGTGRVTGATVASSKGASPSLEACMIKAVATWSFPAPAGGAPAIIRYPFSF